MPDQRTFSASRPRRMTPLRHDGRDYLTTAQAARVLGVKAETIYAYVSRGRLTSARIAGVGGSVFAVDEVEALTRRSTSRPPAGVVERIRTQITLLDDDRLFFRGADATALAVDSDPESVAALLWDHPVVWEPHLLPARVFRQISALRSLPSRGVDTIKITVDVLGSRDRFRHQITPDAVTTKAVDVLANSIAALPLLSEHPIRGVSSAARLWPRLSRIAATPQRIRLLNGVLVLLADHDLSAGTIAARVAASARGSVYSVITAGLGALDGPLHGGAATAAYLFLTEAMSDPASALSVRLASGTAIPGCGHLVYQNRDPRADTIFDQLEKTTGGNRDVLATIRELRPLIARTEARFMNSDMALAAVALRYDMPVDAAETIFAIARITGWVAHALEEYQEPRLRFRPQGVYVGVRP